MSIRVDVNAKHGLKEVVWDAGALVAAGGALTVVGDDEVKVVLPDYQASNVGIRPASHSVVRGGSPSTGSTKVSTAQASNAKAPNSYVLGAIAYDSWGNASERVTTNVIVLPNEGKPSISKGDMSVVVDGAAADGKARNKVQVLVTDSISGEPVKGEQVTFIASNGETLVTASVATEVTGVAVVELTSTTVGASAVTATLSNGVTQSKDVNFFSGTPVAETSTIKTNETSPAM